MHYSKVIPALALLAPLVAAQSDDTPIVSAFVEYMDREGLSSLSAEGLTQQAVAYSSLVDSIESVLATADPSARVFVESYVSEAVFADPTLSSVMASITSEYGDDDATPAATASDGSASATSGSDSSANTGSSDSNESASVTSAGGSATSAAASDGAAGHAVDARYLTAVSGVIGAAVLGFAVLL